MLIDVVNHSAGCSSSPKSVLMLSLQEDNPSWMISFLHPYVLHSQLKSGRQRDEKLPACKSLYLTPLEHAFSMAVG